MAVVSWAEGTDVEGEAVVTGWVSRFAMRDFDGTTEVVAGEDCEGSALEWDADATSLWPRVPREEDGAVE